MQIFVLLKCADFCFSLSFSPVALVLVLNIVTKIIRTVQYLCDLPEVGKICLGVIVLVFILSYDEYFSFLFSFSLQGVLVFVNDNFSFSFCQRKQPH